MASISPWIVLPVVIVTYITYTIIHRLYYNPLAKFPGPKLAAASWAYEIYYDLLSRPKTSYMYEIRRMHQIYGTSLSSCGSTETVSSSPQQVRSSASTPVSSTSPTPTFITSSMSTRRRCGRPCYPYDGR